MKNFYQFFAILNFCRIFISHLAKVMHPLTKILQCSKNNYDIKHWSCLISFNYSLRTVVKHWQVNISESKSKTIFCSWHFKFFYRCSVATMYIKWMVSFNTKKVFEATARYNTFRCKFRCNLTFSSSSWRTNILHFCKS